MDIRHLSLQTTVGLILNCLDHHRRKINQQLLLCYHMYVGHVSESIKRLLAPLNIRTCFKPHKTLRELLVHPKDHIPDIKKPGVVYSISCNDCDSVYVGQTGRTLEHRMKEHKRALCSLDVNTSSVASRKNIVLIGRVLES